MSDSGIPHEGHNKIPKGWMAFFIGVIIFLVVYIVRFTPAISGWSFYKSYEEEMKAGEKAAASAPADPGMYIGNADAIAAARPNMRRAAQPATRLTPAAVSART